MNRNQPPRIAKWLLRHVATSRNIEAISGDLDERYDRGRSRVWYWRQIAVAIVVSTFNDIRNHKLLTLRALIVGWFVFWFLWARLVQYSVPYFQPVTQVLVESLYKTLYAVRNLPELGVVGAVRSLFAGGVVGREDFWLFVRSMGNVESVVWTCYGAFATLGSCIVGILSGWIVGRLHRRKMSMVLAHGTTVLVNWIVLGLTTHPVVWPPLIWFVPVLTLSIVLGGVLCASRQNIVMQQDVSL
jgi:hypothetical protein